MTPSLCVIHFIYTGCPSEGFTTSDNKFKKPFRVIFIYSQNMYQKSAAERILLNMSGVGIKPGPYVSVGQ